MDKSRKKEKYRFFEALNILNQQDIASGAKTTGNVGQCLQVIETRMHRGGCAVTMGAPAQELAALHAGDKIPVLLIVNKKAYEELQYPAEEEEYKPVVLIDHITDRETSLPMMDHINRLKGLLSLATDRIKRTEIMWALESSDLDGYLSGLKAVRTADRELSIEIRKSECREFNFKIDF